MATPSGHPGRTLIILGAIIAALYGLMALSGTWTPKLGLDLQGGTTITLTAPNTTGTGQVDPVSLQLAKTIIQSRVDSLGVGESEVTTSGNNQIVVSVPNVQQDELVRLVGQTAQLRFRAVYDVQAVEPPATASPSPTAGASSEPSAGASSEPSASSTAGADPSASQSAAAEPSASATGNGRPAPALPTAPGDSAAGPAQHAAAPAPRPTRRWSGSRARPTPPTSPPSPATRPTRWSTSPTSRCSPATRRGPRSTCSARP